jgi:AcrR family transcriptional regulator
MFRKEKNFQVNTKRRVETQSSIDRRSEIHERALELFIANGYDATSLAAIAKELGISKANLYYYYPTKEGLLYQIHMDALRNHFVPMLDEADKIIDPQDRIVFFLKKFASMCTSSPSSRVFVHEIRSLNKTHQKEIKSFWRRAYQLLGRSIEELQKSGKGRKFKKSFLSFLGVGMAFWIIYWWDYNRQANAEELAETLIQIFLHGLLYS